MATLPECLSLLSSQPGVFLQGDCVAVVASKLIGYGVIAGSALVKLPQILKIRSAGSVGGISHASVFFDFVATLINVSYFLPLGYPFSTWGENAFLLAQNGVVFAMHAHYSGGVGGGFVVESAVCCAVAFLLYRRAVPDFELPAAACGAFRLQSCTVTCESLTGALPMLLGMIGRLPQIAQNLRQGHTGELAFITYFMNVLGNLARLFTTMQVRDPYVYRYRYISRSRSR